MGSGFTYKTRKWVLSRCVFCGHAAAASFGIDELGQDTAEVLFLRWHAELNPARTHVLIELLDIWNIKSQFNRAGRILFRGRMQSECGFAGGKLAPAGRFQLQR